MTTAQDGVKVVSLMHRPPLFPENTPGTHFCYRLTRHQAQDGGKVVSLSTGRPYPQEINLVFISVRD